MARGKGRGVWLLAFAVLLGGSAATVAGAYLLDAAMAAERPRGLLSLATRPVEASALLSVSSVPEVVVAILGIAITVVSIVVELASSRYTGKIADLFLRDPVNFGVLG